MGGVTVPILHISQLRQSLSNLTKNAQRLRLGLRLNALNHGAKFQCMDSCF